MSRPTARTKAAPSAHTASSLHRKPSFGDRSERKSRSNFGASFGSSFSDPSLGDSSFGMNGPEKGQTTDLGVQMERAIALQAHFMQASGLGNAIQHQSQEDEEIKAKPDSPLQRQTVAGTTEEEDPELDIQSKAEDEEKLDRKINVAQLQRQQDEEELREQPEKKEEKLDRKINVAQLQRQQDENELRQLENAQQEDELRPRLWVQPKLTIGQPGDKYEQEADRTAAQVMAMPDGGAGVQGSRGVEEWGSSGDRLQSKPYHPITQSPHYSITPSLQSKGSAPAVPENFENQLAQQKGSGQPLSDEARSFMEPRFGADFSNVRVHETPDLANAIQAQAFTHGQDIYFNSGKYNPGSSGGKELLAHELTHVVQQSTRHIQCFSSSRASAEPQNNAELQSNNKYIGSAGSISWIHPNSPAGSMPLVGVKDPEPPKTITEGLITGSSGFRFSNYLQGYVETKDSISIDKYGYEENSGVYAAPSQFGLESEIFPVKKAPPRFVEYNGLQGIQFEQLVGSRTTSPAKAGRLGGAIFGSSIGGSLAGLPGTLAGLYLGGKLGTWVANELFNFPPIWTKIQLTIMADGTQSSGMIEHSFFPSHSFYNDFQLSSSYIALAAEQEAWQSSGWDSGNPWGVAKPTWEVHTNDDEKEKNSLPKFRGGKGGKHGGAGATGSW